MGHSFKHADSQCPNNEFCELCPEFQPQLEMVVDENGRAELCMSSQEYKELLQFSDMTMCSSVGRPPTLFNDSTVNPLDIHSWSFEDNLKRSRGSSDSEGEIEADLVPKRPKLDDLSSMIETIECNAPAEWDPVFRQFPLPKAWPNRSELVKGLERKNYRAIKCCGKQFGSKEEFAHHLDIHHEAWFRPWICPSDECIWSVLGFRTYQECSKHVLAVHTCKKYKCIPCTYSGVIKLFGRRDSLRRHIKDNHLSQNNTPARGDRQDSVQ